MEILIAVAFAFVVAFVIAYVVRDAFSQVKEHERQENIRIKCSIAKHDAIAQDKSEGLY